MTLPSRSERGPDRWVNAVIEITVPMDDVPVSASNWRKSDAVAVVMDRVLEALPDDLAQHVASGHWEDATDA